MEIPLSVAIGVEWRRRLAEATSSGSAALSKGSALAKGHGQGYCTNHRSRTSCPQTKGPIRTDRCRNRPRAVPSPRRASICLQKAARIRLARDSIGSICAPTRGNGKRRATAKARPTIQISRRKGSSTAPATARKRRRRALNLLLTPALRWRARPRGRLTAEYATEHQ
jgi:hypothetical protein